MHEASQEAGTDKSAGEAIPQLGTRCDFIDLAGTPPTMTPDWNHNPGKAGQRLLNKLEADQLSAAPPPRAREAIKDKLNSPEFDAAFQSGDVRGWEVAVLPDDVAQALRQHGVKLTGQIVADGIRPHKLAQKHHKVSVEQYQIWQRVLDKGGVYLQTPKIKRKTPALLAEYQDDNGQWWFYAIDMKDMRARTIFDSSPQYRAKKFKQKEIKVIRKWDRDRWLSRGGK